MIQQMGGFNPALQRQLQPGGSTSSKPIKGGPLNKIHPKISPSEVGSVLAAPPTPIRASQQDELSCSRLCSIMWAGWTIGWSARPFLCCVSGARREVIDNVNDLYWACVYSTEIICYFRNPRNLTRNHRTIAKYRNVFVLCVYSIVYCTHSAAVLWIECLTTFNVNFTLQFNCKPTKTL